MTLMLSKIKIVGPPTKNSDFPDFSGILLIFSTEISRSEIDISISFINHLLELGKFFSTIYEQIMWLKVFALKIWKIT